MSALLRYTAALDAIKKDRKDRVADLKAEKAHLDHLKADKDRAETVRCRRSSDMPSLSF